MASEGGGPAPSNGDGAAAAAAAKKNKKAKEDAAAMTTTYKVKATGSSHGEGCCAAAWCQIDGGEGGRGGEGGWHALTTGSDGKLVLRNGDSEALDVIKISGDHEKASPCIAVSGDGKTVASVEGCYVQVGDD